MQHQLTLFQARYRLTHQLYHPRICVAGQQVNLRMDGRMEDNWDHSKSMRTSGIIVITTFLQ